jgi:hypothetical protein
MIHDPKRPFLSLVVTRSSIAASIKVNKKQFFINHEVHEVKKYLIFLRDLRALRGENLPFSKLSVLSRFGFPYGHINGFVADS